MSDKRTCIFTNNPSNFKLNLTSTKDDLHNWAKSVPATREYVEGNGLLDRALNKREMKLVELFYEQELARLRVSNIEAQMADLRLKLEETNSLPTSDQYFAEIAAEIEYDDEDDDNYVFPTCREDIVSDKVIEEYKKLEKEDIKDNSHTHQPVAPKSHDEIIESIAKYVEEGIAEQATEELTKEEENVTVKKIVTKKKGLWD